MTHVVSTERQPGVTSENFTEKRTFGLELKNDREEQQGEGCSGRGERVSTALRKEEPDGDGVSGGR